MPREDPTLPPEVVAPPEMFEIRFLADNAAAEEVRLARMRSLREKALSQFRSEQPVSDDQSHSERFETLLKAFTIFLHPPGLDEDVTLRSHIPLPHAAPRISKPPDGGPLKDVHQGFTLEETPAYIRASASNKLRPYQLDGVSWLLGLHARGVNGILADEMGLGKTYQTVTLLSSVRFMLGLPGPYLVVCPKSVLASWRSELQNRSPLLRVLLFHGTMEQRIEIRMTLETIVAKGVRAAAAHREDPVAAAMTAAAEFVHSLGVQAAEVGSVASSCDDDSDSSDSSSESVAFDASSGSDVGHVARHNRKRRPAPKAKPPTAVRYARLKRKEVEELVKSGLDVQMLAGAAVGSVYDVILTTFDVMLLEQVLATIKFRYLVLDEAHRVKNEQSQTAAKARLIPADFRLFLTGTPLQNNLHELWALLNFLRPEIFTVESSADFDAWFDAKQGFAARDVVPRLHQLLKPLMLRRLKKDVDKSLPPKKEVLVGCPITAKQLEWYQRVLLTEKEVVNSAAAESMRERDEQLRRRFEEERERERIEAERSVSSGPPLPAPRGDAEDMAVAVVRQQMDSFEAKWEASKEAARSRAARKPAGKTMRALNNTVMQLRKVCNHPYLFPEACDSDYVTESIVYDCGKMQMLDKMLGRLLYRGHKVLIFSQFTQVLDIIERFLDYRGLSKVCPSNGLDRVSGEELLEEHIQPPSAESPPCHGIPRDRLTGEKDDPRFATRPWPAAEHLPYPPEDNPDDRARATKGAAAAEEGGGATTTAEGEPTRGTARGSNGQPLHFQLPVSYCRLDGKVSANGRCELMEAFNAPNSPIFCFLLSTRAGGLGITLTAADTVILYDSDWNPQQDLQAQDRAHRIGQTRPVTVYRLITSSTIEERIYYRGVKKLYLDAVVIRQARAEAEAERSGDKAASREELLSMIRFGAESIFTAEAKGAVGDTDLVKDEEVDAIMREGRTFSGGAPTQNSGGATSGVTLATFTLSGDDGDISMLGDNFAATLAALQESKASGGDPQTVTLEHSVDPSSSLLVLNIDQSIGQRELMSVFCEYGRVSGILATDVETIPVVPGGEPGEAAAATAAAAMPAAAATDALAEKSAQRVGLVQFERLEDSVRAHDEFRARMRAGEAVIGECRAVVVTYAASRREVISEEMAAAAAARGVNATLKGQDADGKPKLGAWEELIAASRASDVLMRDEPRLRRGGKISAPSRWTRVPRFAPLAPFSLFDIAALRLTHAIRRRIVVAALIDRDVLHRVAKMVRQQRSTAKRTLARALQHMSNVAQRLRTELEASANASGRVEDIHPPVPAGTPAAQAAAAAAAAYGALSPVSARRGTLGGGGRMVDDDDDSDVAVTKRTGRAARAESPAASSAEASSSGSDDAEVEGDVEDEVAGAAKDDASRADGVAHFDMYMLPLARCVLRVVGAKVAGHAAALFPDEVKGDRRPPPRTQAQRDRERRERLRDGDRRLLRASVRSVHAVAETARLGAADAAEPLSLGDEGLDEDVKPLKEEDDSKRGVGLVQNGEQGAGRGGSEVATPVVGGDDTLGPSSAPPPRHVVPAVEALQAVVATEQHVARLDTISAVLDVRIELLNQLLETPFAAPSTSLAPVVAGFLYLRAQERAGVQVVSATSPAVGEEAGLLIPALTRNAVGAAGGAVSAGSTSTPAAALPPRGPSYTGGDDVMRGCGSVAELLDPSAEFAVDRVARELSPFQVVGVPGISPKKLQAEIATAADITDDGDATAAAFRRVLARLPPPVAVLPSSWPKGAKPLPNSDGTKDAGKMTGSPVSSSSSEPVETVPVAGGLHAFRGGTGVACPTPTLPIADALVAVATAAEQPKVAAALLTRDALRFRGNIPPPPPNASPVSLLPRSIPRPDTVPGDSSEWATCGLSPSFSSFPVVALTPAAALAGVKDALKQSPDAANPVATVHDAVVAPAIAAGAPVVRTLVPLDTRWEETAEGGSSFSEVTFMDLSATTFLRRVLMAAAVEFGVVSKAADVAADRASVYKERANGDASAAAGDAGEARAAAGADDDLVGCNPRHAAALAVGALCTLTNILRGGHDPSARGVLPRVREGDPVAVAAPADGDFDEVSSGPVGGGASGDGRGAGDGVAAQSVEGKGRKGDAQSIVPVGEVIRQGIAVVATVGCLRRDGTGPAVAPTPDALTFARGVFPPGPPVFRGGEAPPPPLSPSSGLVSLASADEAFSPSAQYAAGVLILALFDEREARLRREGFPQIRRNDYFAFQRLLAKYGHSVTASRGVAASFCSWFAQMSASAGGSGTASSAPAGASVPGATLTAEHPQFPLSEARRYVERVWSHGRALLPPEEWSKIAQRSSAGTTKSAQAHNASIALQFKTACSSQPWARLNLAASVGGAGRQRGRAVDDERNVSLGGAWSPLEDRLLVNIMAAIGIRDWDRVRLQLQRSWELRHNLFIMTRTSREVEGRGRFLLRQLEREYYDYCSVAVAKSALMSVASPPLVARKPIPKRGGGGRGRGRGRGRSGGEEPVESEGERSLGEDVGRPADTASPTPAPRGRRKADSSAAPPAKRAKKETSSSI